MQYVTRYLAFSLALLITMGCGDLTAPVAIERIVLSPATTPTLLVGPGGAHSLQLTAVAMRENDVPLASARISWSTSTPLIIGVSSTGVVTARSAGLGVVHASARGASATAIIAVALVPVATARIGLDTLFLEVGPLGASTRVLAVDLRDSIGFRLTNRPVQWSSSQPAIVAVSANGVVTASEPGSAYVHVSAERARDSVLAIVRATLGAPVGVDVAVIGAQWTQGVQSADHAIPILRGGRAAVVNVTTRATGAVAGATMFALRLFDAVGRLTHSDTASATIVSGTTTVAEPTVQFLVPTARLVPGTRWEVVRDPHGTAADAFAETDRLPLVGTHALDLLSPPLLRLHFVPIVLSSHGHVRGNVSTSVVGEYLRTVRSMMPHGEIEATVGAPMTTPQLFGNGALGGESAFWIAVVNQLDAMRLADPARADAHWIGVVRPPKQFTWTAYGGFGFVPANGTTYGPSTRTFAVIGINWFSRESATRELVAHELGHNLGRLHAPCGGAGAQDAQFPVPGGVIGEGAHDTFAWESGRTTRAAVVPSGTPDVMGYCAPVWISAYNYLGMLRFRGEQDAESRALAVQTRVLLVRGEVAGSTVTIDAPVIIGSTVSERSESGEWLVEGRAVDGTTLFRQRFSLSRYDHSDSVRPFAVTVPLDASMENRLATLHVTGVSEAAVRQYPD